MKGAPPAKWYASVSLLEKYEYCRVLIWRVPNDWCIEVILRSNNRIEAQSNGAHCSDIATNLARATRSAQSELSTYYLILRSVRGILWVVDTAAHLLCRDSRVLIRQCPMRTTVLLQAPTPQCAERTICFVLNDSRRASLIWVCWYSFWWLSNIEEYMSGVHSLCVHEARVVRQCDPIDREGIPNPVEPPTEHCFCLQMQPPASASNYRVELGSKYLQTSHSST